MSVLFKKPVKAQNGLMTKKSMFNGVDSGKLKEINSIDYLPYATELAKMYPGSNMGSMVEKKVTKRNATPEQFVMNKGSKYAYNIDNEMPIRFEDTTLQAGNHLLELSAPKTGTFMVSPQGPGNLRVIQFMLKKK